MSTQKLTPNSCRYGGAGARNTRSCLRDLPVVSHGGQDEAVPGDAVWPLQLYKYMRKNKLHW